MIDIKIIKTEKEYEEALARIEALMDAAPGSAQEEELELISLLVEKFEEEHFPIDPPDPVEAILFRMDQEGLTAKDMIPYLGSQSKVSEVLNRKRPLSLAMIRALNQGLGIPAEVLLQPAARPENSAAIELDQAASATAFINCFALANQLQRGELKMWQSQAVQMALKQPGPPFDRSRLDETFWRDLIGLSRFTKGPQMAGELLNRKGIHLVVHKLNIKTELDGACFFTAQNRPVIGLTLYHNRLEDFWLMLLHQLVHLYLHQDKEPAQFFDSLECALDKAAPAQEREVNQFLKDILVPPAAWQTIWQDYQKDASEVVLEKAAQTLEVGPEIIACRLRLESRTYDKTSSLVAPKKVSEKLEVYG